MWMQTESCVAHGALAGLELQVVPQVAHERGRDRGNSHSNFLICADICMSCAWSVCMCKYISLTYGHMTIAYAQDKTPTAPRAPRASTSQPQDPTPVPYALHP